MGIGDWGLGIGGWGFGAGPPTPEPQTPPPKTNIKFLLKKKNIN